jgi:hypothetical protein
VWRVVHRLYPQLFDRAVPNPWDGVTKKRRTLRIKPAATREQVYAFAKGAIERGHPEAAAAAVICFEWLQRPENVIGGYLTWPDYRPDDFPHALRIFHHKTGKVVWHPLRGGHAGTVWCGSTRTPKTCSPSCRAPTLIDLLFAGFE